MRSAVAELLADLSAALDGAHVEWYVFGDHFVENIGAASPSLSDDDVRARGAMATPESHP